MKKSREEALSRPKEMIEPQMVASGAEIVPLEFPSTGHPWADFAGTLKFEPFAEAWRRAMAEYRSKAEADPDLP